MSVWSSPQYWLFLKPVCFGVYRPAGGERTDWTDVKSQVKLIHPPSQNPTPTHQPLKQTLSLKRTHVPSNELSSVLAIYRAPLIRLRWRLPTPAERGLWFTSEDHCVELWRFLWLPSSIFLFFVFLKHNHYAKMWVYKCRSAEKEYVFIQEESCHK